jgi:predicted amidohydrolase YtcJ
LQHALSLGIGTIHELGGPQISGPADFTELLSLEDARKPRIVGYWGEGIGPDAALNLKATGAAGDYFVDGAIGSRTALLVEPYADDEHTLGAQYLTAEQLRDHITACSVRGVQAGFHVIGDGAMELVAAAFVEAEAQVGTDRVRSAAHRLEHVEMVTAEQIELFARLGITISAQPVFDQRWGGAGGMYETRLGSRRAPTLNPFAAMLAAGVPLAFGSDAPVTPLAPWEAIRAAAHHHTATHAISVRAAFAAHTRGGWRAAGAGHGGVIAPGEPADLAVWQVDELVVQAPDDRVAAWSTDPRSGVAPLPNVEPGAPLPQCLQTIVNGLTVYTAPPKNDRETDDRGKGEVS